MPIPGYNYIASSHLPVDPNAQNIAPEWFYIIEVDSTSVTQELPLQLEVTAFWGDHPGVSWDQGGIALKWPLQLTINSGIITALMSTSQAQICAGDSVVFSDASQGSGINSWNWSFPAKRLK